MNDDRRTIMWDVVLAYAVTIAAGVMFWFGFVALVMWAVSR